MELKYLFKSIRKIFMSNDDKIDELLQRITRLNKDVDQIKLMSGNILENNRGITFLASGDMIYIDPRDTGCGSNLLNEGKYEEDEIRIFRKFLKPGGTVLDIGSNYGYYSITAAPYLRPGGTVYAFEPNPHIFELMKSSVFMNGYRDIVKPCRTAVYDSSSVLRFAINEKEPGGARVVADDYIASDEMKVIDVPVVSIDEFLSDDIVVDLVKIDVEGKEKNVLRGMENVISRSPDIFILMELFYSFFESEEEFRNFISYINSSLNLNIYKQDGSGNFYSVEASDLLNKENYVLLSKRKEIVVPDLTIYPKQLNISEESTLDDQKIKWSATHTSNDLIFHGPYVYLPKGDYRMKVLGKFEGEFRIQIQENLGDVVWRGTLGSGSGQEFNVPLRFDAPRMEIACWSTGDQVSALEIDRIEFWKF